MTRERRASSLAIVLLFVVGCGQPGTEPTAKVTGRVTSNGEPMEGVILAFMPASGRPASGMTDASGKFTLSTFKPGDGAVPGPHKVGIGEPFSDEPPLPGEPGARDWQAPKWRFPEKYADPERSGFTANVELGKANEFTFDMTD